MLFILKWIILIISLSLFTITIVTLWPTISLKTVFNSLALQLGRSEFRNCKESLEVIWKSQIDILSHRVFMLFLLSFFTVLNACFCIFIHYSLCYLFRIMFYPYFEILFGLTESWLIFSVFLSKLSTITNTFELYLSNAFNSLLALQNFATVRKSGSIL